VAALAASSEGVSPEALAQHMVARVMEEDGGWVMEGKLMQAIIELFMLFIVYFCSLLFLTIVVFVVHCLFWLIVVSHHCYFCSFLFLLIVVFHHCYFSPL